MAVCHVNKPGDGSVLTGSEESVNVYGLLLSVPPDPSHGLNTPGNIISIISPECAHTATCGITFIALKICQVKIHLVQH